MTSEGTLFTIPCEAIACGHDAVYRAALVGVGEAPHQTPVMLLETWTEQRPASQNAQQRLCDEVFQRLQESSLTRSVARDCVLWHPQFPVDIRHNAKIFREQLAPWAERALRRSGVIPAPRP